MHPNVRAFRPLLRLLDGPARRWMGAIFALRLVERILLAVVALSFSNDRATTAIAITVLLGVVGGLRAAARAPLLAIVRRRYTALVTDALLRRRALAPASKHEPTDLVIFEALWVAEELFAERLPGLVADALAALLLCALILSTVPGSMIAVGVVVLALAALASEGARRLAGTYAQRSWAAFLPLASSVEACVHGGLELVGNGRDRDQEEVVVARTHAWIQSAWRADWLSGLAGRLPILIGFVGVMIAIVTTQTSRGVAPESALAEGLVVASFLPPFASILSNAIELARTAPKIAPLRELLDPDEAPAPTRSPRRDLPIAPFVIEWTSIDYAYPLGDGRRGQRVLSDESGEWKPGHVVAITGPNGAGKSTLLRLFLGLDRPQRGSVRAGGVPLDELDLDAWRANVAYLPQRPFMPATSTVRETIRFLARDATDMEIIHALERVGLWKRLTTEAADQPLDTPVGSLSAGERQRLALARVLVRDADLVLLDEPDANLDRAGVELLGSLLRELAQGKMLAFVAHNEDLLGAADHVIRLALSRIDHGIEFPEYAALR